MKGSTHLAAGLLVGAAIGLVAQADRSALALTIGAAGLAALAPDWLQVNLPGVNQIVKGGVGHRGISHWLLVPFAIWLALQWGDLGKLSGPIAAGWISHIVLDSFSGGVPALWPWPGRVTLAQIKTGSNLDTITGAACLALAGVLLISNLVRV